MTDLAELIGHNVAGDLDAIADDCRRAARSAQGDDAAKFKHVANRLTAITAGIRLALREETRP